LNEFISSNRLDFVGIQETKKSNFDEGLLDAISRDMAWKFIPARGTAGGILVGFRNLIFKVVSWELSQYCATTIVKNLEDDFTWRLVVVYGSPYEELKEHCMAGLDEVLGRWQGATLIRGGGDLIWLGTKEKRTMV
jgi:hypothetical protein